MENKVYEGGDCMDILKDEGVIINYIEFQEDGKIQVRGCAEVILLDGRHFTGTVIGVLR